MFDNRTRKTSSFLIIAIATLSVALFGFWFTYWKPVFAGETFPALLHVHAALWFGWFVLMVGQALFIKKNHRVAHRRVGLAGVLYSVVLILVAAVIAIQTIARDAHLITGSIESVPTIIPLTQILMFAVFFALAVVKREQSDVHKRLIVLAALVAVTPALARISIGALGAPNVPLLFTISNLIVLVACVMDCRATHRVHPVYLWGGVAILAVRIVRIPLAMSPAWESAARGLASLVTA